MTETRKLRVFLCHSSQDKPIVRELYQRLNDEGWIDPWLDEEKLLPGQDWDIEIEKAVETANAVIVCLSNNSVTKEGYVQKELRSVLDVADEKPDGTIFVIPIRLDSCSLPRRLKKWQYVDYFPSEQISNSYQRLCASLKSRIDAVENELSRNEDKLSTIVFDDLQHDEPENLDQKKKWKELDSASVKADLLSYSLPESLAIIECAGFILAIFSAVIVNISAPLSWNFNHLLFAAFIINIILVFCIPLLRHLIPSYQVQKYMIKVKVTNYWLIFMIWILPLPIYYLIVFKLLRG